MAKYRITMARPKRLNDASSEVIEKNFLEQTPEGLPDATGLVIAKDMPIYRTIQFFNGRDPGYALQFHYHSKTHPLKQYTLYHGMKHDLPEEIIEHLENCGEHIYGYRPDVQGKPEMYVQSKKYLFQCKTVRKAA